ncbi:hypothetical protein O6H91_19G074100 [Diphasiastrum complanatum]|uniref:Uncharacterized protein n=1 Tax=Diphasiastrum complanatum TaxID=34168 RepID=A0ACC2AWK1_DIPCM|nr:hypothetical protein O6H91_19G074100 [Diphasiastrum complanatum]
MGDDSQAEIAHLPDFTLVPNALNNNVKKTSSQMVLGLESREDRADMERSMLRNKVNPSATTYMQIGNSPSTSVNATNLLSEKSHFQYELGREEPNPIPLEHTIHSFKVNKL